MNYSRHRPSGKWQDYVRITVSAYRLLAFIIAVFQVFVFSTSLSFALPPVILVAAVGVYSLFKVLHPFRWQEERNSGIVLLSLDVAVCFFLIMTTGGLYSPFLLYTLAPVLTAALLMKGVVTFTVAGLSAVYVIGGHMGNPFFELTLALAEISYFLIYIIAISLSAVLPYMINVNLRQRLQAEDTLLERQRLSREIHDGTAQTLSAMCWQVQLLRRRLAETGVDYDELEKLDSLATKARQDTRESLEMLRNYSGSGAFVNHLKKYLEHFKLDSGIDYGLDAYSDELNLEATVELELLRICQEALTNVKKHSGATKVQITVKRVDHHYAVNINDNGKGFDSLSYYFDKEDHSSGQGISVMRERAESVGGRLWVISTPGQGTDVQIEIPASYSRLLTWLKL